MPGGAGRSKRACKMCKPHGWLGNNAGRFSAKEEAQRKALKKETEVQ